MRVIKLDGGDEFVTTKKAADLFGVSQVTMYRRVVRHNIPVFTLGGRAWLLRLSDLLAIGMVPKEVEEDNGDPIERAELSRRLQGWLAERLGQSGGTLGEDTGLESGLL